MLEGTDLFAAYQSFQQHEEAPSPAAPAVKQEVQPTFNKELFNQQYEQEQRIAKAIQELKKQKESFNAAAAAAATTAAPQQEGISYLDKLTSKKKELGRMLQYALIIALGLSIHFLVDEYIKHYIANNDVSVERQIIIKLLYPLSLVFIIWNLKAFVR